jgi:hypothetical protein
MRASRQVFGIWGLALRAQILSEIRREARRHRYHPAKASGVTWRYKQKDILQGIDKKLHVANTLQNFDLRFKDRRTIHVVACAKRTAMASPARSPPVRCYHREPSRNGLRLRFRRKTM